MDNLKQHLAELAAKPEHTEPSIEVQHILIGFLKGDGSTSVPGADITRSKAEAETLVAEILGKVASGADFGDLVKAHTNDSFPGIYGMFLKPGAGNPRGAYPRNGMVPAFGNVGWKLAVGEVGVAEFDTGKSPYGWHIIKRLK